MAECGSEKDHLDAGNAFKGRKDVRHEHNLKISASTLIDSSVVIQLSAAKSPVIQSLAEKSQRKPNFPDTRVCRLEISSISSDTKSRQTLECLVGRFYLATMRKYEEIIIPSTFSMHIPDDKRES